MDICGKREQDFRDSTNKMVPYNFPKKRTCQWCKHVKSRMAGRWVTKAVWVCNECIKAEKEADHAQRVA